MILDVRESEECYGLLYDADGVLLPNAMSCDTELGVVELVVYGSKLIPAIDEKNECVKTQWALFKAPLVFMPFSYDKVERGIQRRKADQSVEAKPLKLLDYKQAPWKTAKQCLGSLTLKLNEECVPNGNCVPDHVVSADVARGRA